MRLTRATPQRVVSPANRTAAQRLRPGRQATAVRAPALPSVQAQRRTQQLTGARADVPRYASTEGYFVNATPDQVADLQAAYLRSKAGGMTQPPDGAVSRVAAGDLAVNLETASPAQRATLEARGVAELPHFYYFTSGAGLWSRGGGQVKALIPFNLEQLLEPAQLDALGAASDIINAKSPADVLLISKTDVPAGSSVEETAAGVVGAAKKRIETLLAGARQDPRGLPPLAMKLVNVALASRRAGTYVPFDVWTSPQTHGPICDYLEEFRATYAKRQFHPDPQVQAGIVGALRDYFAQSDAHRDTHVFGMQVGFHALHPETGAPLADTPVIGEGAGRAKAYLDASGRTAQLRAAGKRNWVFENIEVISDLPVMLGAHGKAGKPVSVVLVPQRDGYAGGNPFLVQKPDGSTNLELHEQSVLPQELRQGNAFFNSNTILQPLDAAPPKGLGFEVKNRGTQVRAKQNAGDITKELACAGIGGRIGVEYENFKNYHEFANNGRGLIATYRDIWCHHVAAMT